MVQTILSTVCQTTMHQLFISLILVSLQRNSRIQERVFFSSVEPSLSVSLETLIQFNYQPSKKLALRCHSPKPSRQTSETRPRINSKRRERNPSMFLESLISWSREQTSIPQSWLIFSSHKISSHSTKLVAHLDREVHHLNPLHLLSKHRSLLVRVSVKVRKEATRMRHRRRSRKSPHLKLRILR